MRDFETTMDAESDSEVAVRFSKSRSPPRNRLTEGVDGLTEDIFMPLVAGDEFEERGGNGSRNVWC